MASSSNGTLNSLVLMPAAAALVPEPFPALLAVAVSAEQGVGLDLPRL